jgi:hypothetical protein
MLSVGWEHMTREDSGVLTEWFRKDDPPTILASFEDGWFMYVWATGEGPPEEADLSESFHKILRLSREMDCDYVHFDIDGATHDSLDTHEWGPVIEWGHGDDGDDWPFMLDTLSELMGATTRWYCRAENLGWRNTGGEKTFTADNGEELLRAILPKTDCTFKVWRKGDGGLSINNFHHDSPTGEWFHLTPTQ